MFKTLVSRKFSTSLAHTLESALGSIDSKQAGLIENLWSGPKIIRNETPEKFTFQIDVPKLKPGYSFGKKDLRVSVQAGQLIVKGDKMAGEDQVAYNDTCYLPKTCDQKSGTAIFKNGKLELEFGKKEDLEAEFGKKEEDLEAEFIVIPIKSR